MTDSTGGIDAWITHTSNQERIQAVVRTVSKPRSSSFIANEANVEQSVARDHLEELAETNAVLLIEEENKRLYGPNMDYTAREAAADLASEFDEEGLLELREKMERDIEGWRAEFGIPSPENLREYAQDTDEASEAIHLRNVARKWELVRYRLTVVEHAVEHFSRA
ncbi:ArsR family transcriptional regulator [Natronolimnobius sp. AArcel1]|uniref:DUF7342 family protein n=1 Tax=Natronolimnobius sp. AArcel1 TaxID=1679093 RepID=UPI0013EC7F9E|nr:ArsR family transcriptional regulator [Natronolimnobius sp. AArcel1]NGM70248.1 ArsR family transcriptional regulator [Natronolimnobius sp. AArcel1]